MERINIAHFNTDFRSRRDIETALAWSAVKKTLLELDRGDLFEMIQSIRLTDKYIIITTHKPIVNTEISLFREDILARFHISIKTIGGTTRNGIRLV